MNVIASRTFECSDIKAGRAGSDPRQRGYCLACGARWSQDNHSARLGPGGSVTEHSVTGRCRSGPVIKQPWNSEIRTLFHSAHFSKVNDLELIGPPTYGPNSPHGTGVVLYGARARNSRSSRALMLAAPRLPQTSAPAATRWAILIGSGRCCCCSSAIPASSAELRS